MSSSHLFLGQPIVVAQVVRSAPSVVGMLGRTLALLLCLFTTPCSARLGPCQTRS